MSATITLYIPYKDYVSHQKYFDELFELNDSTDIHSMDSLPIIRCNRKSLGTRNKRYSKYMETIKRNFSDCLRNPYGDTERGIVNNKYIDLKTVAYRQGHQFSKKLFNVSESTYMAFTKQDAVKLLDKLVDKSYKEEVIHSNNDKSTISKYLASISKNGYTTWLKGKETYDTFVNAINKLDNQRFILEISY